MLPFVLKVGENVFVNDETIFVTNIIERDFADRNLLGESLVLRRATVIRRQDGVILSCEALIYYETSGTVEYIILLDPSKSIGEQFSDPVTLYQVG